MEELRKEAYGPAGDVARHLPLSDLVAGLRALADAPEDVGVLTLIVRAGWPTEPGRRRSAGA